MEGVIFNGTQARKATSLAEVVLTLPLMDSSTCPEGLDLNPEGFTVGRRLYRSGESEYYLDGRRCRLKDIQALFEGTGLGPEFLCPHRAGTHRPDPQLQAGRPPCPHRGSRAHHPVQEPALLGRDETRDGAAEPAAGQRHHPRGRSAAELAAPPGRQGAPIQPAARGVAHGAAAEVRPGASGARANGWRTAVRGSTPRRGRRTASRKTLPRSNNRAPPHRRASG